MNRKYLRTGVALIVLLAILIQVGAVWAASVSVDVFDDVLTMDSQCRFRTYFLYTFSGVNDSITHRRSYYFNEILDYQGQSVYSTESGSEGGIFSYIYGSNPESCGVLYEILADGELLYTKVWGTVPGYGGSSGGPWFYTQPAAEGLVTSNHQTVPYNGVEACGVFESGWYGRKYLTPENFPACAEFLPDGVEVACMNEEAVWTADNVTGSGVSEGVFYAIVEQHGTCRIFPAG